MDNIDDLFSSEALRLLEDYGYAPDASSRPQELSLGDDASFQEPTHQPSPKRKRRVAPQAIPGCLTLSLADTATPKPKRAKFESKRKDEVASVRKIGACFRCKQLKISVSSTMCPFQ